MKNLFSELQFCRSHSPFFILHSTFFILNSSFFIKFHVAIHSIFTTNSMVYQAPWN